MYKILILITILALFPISVWALDTDHDGLSDDLENFYYTDINNPDTDADGYSDGVEIQYDYSPHKGFATKMNEYDYDDDGLNDWLERWFGSDISKADTDGDGYSDFDEVMYGYSPIDSTGSTRFDRLIEVDRTNQRLYYFVDNVKLYNFPVSTGNPGTDTPAGQFIIEKKIESKRYIGPGYDLPGVLWNMQFKPEYYIHGAYWHNNFGIRTQSHGCVNMNTDDAGILYKYVDIGIPIIVTGETPQNYFVKS